MNPSIALNPVEIIDFEFYCPDGGFPKPWCLVSKNFATGQIISFSESDLQRLCPFPPNTIFITYGGLAEWQCFLSLGWPLPEFSIDLYAEFTNELNPKNKNRRGLLDAAFFYGVPNIGKTVKNNFQAIAMCENPSFEEKQALINYCQTDVEATENIFRKMLPVLSHPVRWAQALIRGSYITSVARIYWTGVPVNLHLLEQLKSHWPDIRNYLITKVNSEYHVYREDRVFDKNLFIQYLRAHKIPWPGIRDGEISIEKKIFEEMAYSYSILEPLRQARLVEGIGSRLKTTIGPDGRNRTWLNPFGTATGRNAPSNTKFLKYGPSCLHPLIAPPTGKALIEVDWEQQEFLIAGVLSGDEAMVQSYKSGDPYLAFGHMSGVIPKGGTKSQYPRQRELCKTLILATQYNMGAASLALRMKISEVEAGELLKKHRSVYKKYWRWAEHNLDSFQLIGSIKTPVLGWTLHQERGFKSNSVYNFPVQGCGANLMQLACICAHRMGITINTPVHDAFMIECDINQIPDSLEKMQQAMNQSCMEILGEPIRTEKIVVKHPHTYATKKGIVLWERILKYLAKVA